MSFVLGLKEDFFSSIVSSRIGITPDIENLLLNILNEKKTTSVSIENKETY